MLILYLRWHFIDSARNIFIAWRNFFWFGLNFFSVPIILRTFFSHWRQYKTPYPRGFDLGEYLKVFGENLISRAMGMIFRALALIAAFIVEILIVIGGLAAILLWFILPFLILIGLTYPLIR